MRVLPGAYLAKDAGAGQSRARAIIRVALVAPARTRCGAGLGLIRDVLVPVREATMAYQTRDRAPLLDSQTQAALETRGKELLGLASSARACSPR